MVQDFIDSASKRAPVLEAEKHTLPALLIFDYLEKFVVYTAVKIHTMTFCVRTPCSLVNSHELFGGGPG